jgi:cytochrome c-type biogenesis protein
MIEYLFRVLGEMTNVIQPFLYNQQFSLVLFAIVMAAGLVAGLTPFGMTTMVFLSGQLHREDGEPTRQKGLFASGLFSLGATISLLLVGIGAAFLGKVMVNYSLAKYFPFITLLMGLQMVGIWKWRLLPKIQLTNREGKSNVLLLGMPFGVVTPPCTAPIIVTILSLVASNGSLSFGLLTLLTFAIGRSIPLILATTYSEVLLRRLKPQRKWYGMLNKALGATFIIGSIYFLTWGQKYFGT